MPNESAQAPMNIVIALFPGVTHLDFTGPHQFFARIPKVNIVVASLGGWDIEADGLTFANLQKLENIKVCDLLCVPGGVGVVDMILVPEFVKHIHRLGSAARYITSICTGSIILAAAGLLEGKNAACHWAWRDLLAQFPNVTVKTERVVRDGNVFTGGGVTAGIDMALTVITEILGEQFAQAIQLGLEYAPEPPFNSGRPDIAPESVLALVKSRVSSTIDEKLKTVMEFIEKKESRLAS
jgi:transcriptional regulator GlxA family with amidase domain